MSIFTVIIVIIVIERDVKVLRRYACEGVKMLRCSLTLHKTLHKTNTTEDLEHLHSLTPSPPPHFIKILLRLDIHPCHIVKFDVVAEGPGVDHLAAAAIVKTLSLAHFLCILEGESSRQQFAKEVALAPEVVLDAPFGKFGNYNYNNYNNYSEKWTPS